MAVDDSYTKMLLHMDGAENGTTFTDEAGNVATPVGNVCTKTGNIFVDLTAGKTYYASSYYNSSYLPSYAFNDVVSSSWHAKTDANNEWVAVDFGNAIVFNALSVLPYYYSGYTPINVQFKDFTLYGSNDSTNGIDGTWAQLRTGTHANSPTWESYTFENSVAYRWAKVVVNSSYRTDFVGGAIAEMEIGVVPRFGNATAYFDGAGDYIRFPLVSDLQFGSGDFTIDTWFRPTPQTQITPVIFSNAGNTTTNGAMSLYAGRTGNVNKYVLGICQGGTWSYPIVSSSNMSNEQWTHIALVRAEDTLSLYINGVAEASITLTTEINGAGDYFTIGIDGALTSACSLKGNIDEFRISKGIARWTDNFTPQDHPYALAPYKASGTALFISTLPTMTEAPQSSSIGWVYSTPPNTSITTFVAISDGTPLAEDYIEAVNGGDIPNLSGVSSGKDMYIKVILSTSDTASTPRLTSLGYSIIEGAQENKVVINLTESGRLKYPIEYVNVNYAKASGNLVGLGNVQVDDFAEMAIPEISSAVFNPNDVESLAASLTGTNNLMRIYYEEYQKNDEALTSNMTGTNVVIHVDDLEN